MFLCVFVFRLKSRIKYKTPYRAITSVWELNGMNWWPPNLTFWKIERPTMNRWYICITTYLRVCVHVESGGNGDGDDSLELYYYIRWCYFRLNLTAFFVVVLKYVKWSQCTLLNGCTQTTHGRAISVYAVHNMIWWKAKTMKLKNKTKKKARKKTNRRHLSTTLLLSSPIHVIVIIRQR